MQKITIAIDGYSSTGKSTLARQLAAALGYVYIDSGAMYRAVTLYALEHDLLEPEKLLGKLASIELHFDLNPENHKSEIHLNGKNVEKQIRSLEVSRKVSEISAIAEVRHKLVELQRSMGKEKGVVMDGRDIGTVVFPDADLKIFMTASPEIRANRRYKELLERGDSVPYQAVLQNVIHRDKLDSTREISPLKKAADAIEVDNSDMGLEEQFERIHAHALRVIAQKEKAPS
jgi:cytidylate kinase